MLSLNMRNDFKRPCVAGTQIEKAHNLGREGKKNLTPKIHFYQKSFAWTIRMHFQRRNFV